MEILRLCVFLVHLLLEILVCFGLCSTFEIVFYFKIFCQGYFSCGSSIDLMQSILSDETQLKCKFIMDFFFSVSFLLSAASASKSEDLIIFDNFDYGSYVVGAE